MVLEECPTTKTVNKFWKNKILCNFPILSSISDSKFLSLKEYISARPQKFYKNQVYTDYLQFLTNFKSENPNDLVKILNSLEYEINNAIKSINDINYEGIHDLIIPKNNIETIQFIENHIHFNYLKLTEAVYHKFIFLIAYENRVQRNKPTEGLEIFNCVEEIQKTGFKYISNCYHNTIRNGIAHGNITFTESNTIYKGKSGKPQEIRTNEIIRLFDDLLDICNGLALAFKVFIILNRDFFQVNNLIMPKQFLIQELKAQANAPRWKVVDCLESVNIHKKKQLNIFTENSLLDLEEVNYYAFRTAVITEYFASGYDRYFFSLKSKYSLPGWAGYDGKILKREKNTNDLSGYKGVLEESLLYFKPKIQLPKFIRKIINFSLIAKSNFWLNYHENTNYRFKKDYELELRDAESFRRNLSIIFNDPSLIITSKNHKEVVKLIRRKYKKIVGFAIRKSKKELNSIFTRFLPTNFIRVTIYQTDLRKRHLRNSGLIDNLICSITLNKSQKIKDIDFVGGKLELKGKYRIVWNGNWSGIKNVH